MPQKPINIIVENRITQGKIVQDFKDKFGRKPTTQSELMSFVQEVRKVTRLPILGVEPVEEKK